ESGSGKSVTSLSIMRLLQKDKSRIEGRIMLDGKDILALPESQMRAVRGNDVAMIFQEPMTSLNPIFTIGRQISEALTCHRAMTPAEARAETIRLLEKVRIPNAAARFDEYPHRFSGGMRQRVGLARALVMEPPVLLMDEAFSALDVLTGERLRNEILELWDGGQMPTQAMLVVSHNIEEAVMMADRVLVFSSNPGRVRA
ncbi:ATP-binding cassette domain-containing protein, partial [Acinetobacter baumannii]|uniref:ATP-binding cassette domain-containing protein n=1 Tax=Acinetobacter baumannii TaxID=470 RepID=UPI001CDD1094